MVSFMGGSFGTLRPTSRKRFLGVRSGAIWSDSKSSRPSGPRARYGHRRPLGTRGSEPSQLMPPLSSTLGSPLPPACAGTLRLGCGCFSPDTSLCSTVPPAPPPPNSPSACVPSTAQSTALAYATLGRPCDRARPIRLDPTGSDPERASSASLPPSSCLPGPARPAFGAPPSAPR